MSLATSRSSAVTFIIVFNGYLSRFFFPLHAASLHRALHFLTEGLRLDSGTWNQLLSHCGILTIEILSIFYVILLTTNDETSEDHDAHTRKNVYTYSTALTHRGCQNTSSHEFASTATEASETRTVS